MFWRQKISQMWVETEFKVSKDYCKLEDFVRKLEQTHLKKLAGLTGQIHIKQMMVCFSHATYD